jgi:hypothetical protein
MSKLNRDAAKRKRSEGRKAPFVYFAVRLAYWAEVRAKKAEG